MIILHQWRVDYDIKLIGGVVVSEDSVGDKVDNIGFEGSESNVFEFIGGILSCFSVHFWSLSSIFPYLLPLLFAGFQ